jgi:prepilin peptidase CpaA
MFYLFLLLCVCSYVSAKDIRCRRITNISIVSLLFVQVLLWFQSELYLWSSLAVLVTGWVLFWCRCIAAGDIKLASVLALALPLNLLPMAAILTGLTGGAVSLCYLMLNHWFPNRKKRQVGIPYGVAISLGFCLVIVVHQVPLLL